MLLDGPKGPGGPGGFRGWTGKKRFGSSRIAREDIKRVLGMSTSTWWEPPEQFPGDGRARLSVPG